MVSINYRQMLAAKQVYHDTNERIVAEIYRKCGSEGVIQFFQAGAELLIKCTSKRGIFRVYDRSSMIIRQEDVLSFIVIGGTETFTVGKIEERVSITLICDIRGLRMRPLILSPDAYGLEHLKVGMVAKPSTRPLTIK